MISGFKQAFQGKDFTNQRVTITANGGTLPTNTSAFLFLYENGNKLNEGVEYLVSGSEIVLNISPIPLGNYEVIFWTEADTSIVENPNDCFTYIFGLSQTECNCFDPKPTDFSKSDSGLYLDQLAPLSKIDGLDNCEAKDVWEAMIEARKEAVMYLKADVNALISKRYERRRASWKGTIGQSSTRTDLHSGKNYVGGVIACAPIASGNLHIKNIGTLFSNTGTVNLLIYNNANEQIADLTLNTTANRHNVNEVDLDLPLLIPYTHETRYYFVAQYDTNNKPKTNKIGCGCGGWDSVWNWKYPYYYEPKRSRANGWSNWIMTGGVQVDTLDSFDLETSINNHLHGFTFDIELGCEAADSICLHTMDYKRDEYALSVAFAARYKAAALLLQRLMLSDSINRNTMLSKEEMEANRREYDAKYINTLQYVAENINLNNSDCFKCRSRMKMGSILT